MPDTPKFPGRTTVAEFLAWDQPMGPRWQLVDGSPQTMSPHNRTQGSMLAELARLMGNHLVEQESSYTLVACPGIVPHVRAEFNYRIADLAVTSSAYAEEEFTLLDPVLIVEIVSPNDEAETWSNLWTYTTTRA